MDQVHAKRSRGPARDGQAPGRRRSHPEEAQRLIEAAIKISPDQEAFLCRTWPRPIKAQGRMDRWQETLDAVPRRGRPRASTMPRSGSSLPATSWGSSEYDKARPYAEAAAQTWAGWAMDLRRRVRRADGRLGGGRTLVSVGSPSATTTCGRPPGSPSAPGPATATVTPRPNPAGAARRQRRRRGDSPTQRTGSLRHRTNTRSSSKHARSRPWPSYRRKAGRDSPPWSRWESPTSAPSSSRESTSPCSPTNSAISALRDGTLDRGRGLDLCQRDAPQRCPAICSTPPRLAAASPTARASPTSAAIDALFDQDARLGQGRASATSSAGSSTSTARPASGRKYHAYRRADSSPWEWLAETPLDQRLLSRSRP